MQASLSQLETSLATLRTDLAAKSTSHKQAMMTKQEILQQTLNETDTASTKSSKAGTSPKKMSEDIVTQRTTQQSICKDKDQVKDSLRELNRQIPILAADFQFEVEQLSANIEVLIE